MQWPFVKFGENNCTSEPWRSKLNYWKGAASWLVAALSRMLNICRCRLVVDDLSEFCINENVSALNMSLSLNEVRVGLYRAFIAKLLVNNSGLYFERRSAFDEFTAHFDSQRRTGGGFCTTLHMYSATLIQQVLIFRPKCLRDIFVGCSYYAKISINMKARHFSVYSSNFLWAVRCWLSWKNR